MQKFFVLNLFETKQKEINSKKFEDCKNGSRESIDKYLGNEILDSSDWLPF